MRVGLVSPYSYTYPGGVGRHVEALAEELLNHGHDVRLMAPLDPDDRIARATHRGARPQRRPLPDYLVPLGRTIGLPANGAVSNISTFPEAPAVLGKELRHGGYDVLHVHEPNGLIASWFATDAAARIPVVGTFHTYSTNRVGNRVLANLVGARRVYAKLNERIAVSEAARWTAQRFYGGEYRVIPNGVDLAAARPAHDHGHDRLELLFVGRAEERKGLPVLLRAFEALRSAGVPARLTVAGATREEVEPLLLDPEGVEIEGRVTDERKWELLGRADLLVAPSLGGESFGMVLTEAFASATPVVCSDIAGYRDVARDGEDSLLVPAGEPADLAEALHALALDPARRTRMSTAAREHAERYAWPNVTREVTEVYEQAIAAPEPATAAHRAAVRVGLSPASGTRTRPKRLPSLEPAKVRRRGALRTARRVAVAAGAVGGIGLTLLALKRLGIHEVAHSMLAAAEIWVFVAFALMCASMMLRAEAWHAILRAAMPGTRVRRRDATRGTMIGVLMSATLPARLGEPSRAYIVARRLGRVRDRLPTVLGTIVSQTILNLVALVVLGSVMLATVGLFRGGVDNLVIATVAPVVVIALLLMTPALLRGGGISRFQRVQQALTVARRAMVDMRRGLTVFRRPRLGSWAVVTQLSAWALQWLACYVLLVALGLDHKAGMGAAAAVLFAVNLTSAIPATPSNVGVFQAACIAVLSAYGVNKTDAFAYGIILQAVEIATAVAMGMPALLSEGMTWKDLRMRAMHAAPVELNRRVGA